jgi:hypothetical protein
MASLPPPSRGQGGGAEGAGTTRHSNSVARFPPPRPSPAEGGGRDEAWIAEREEEE